MFMDKIPKQAVVLLSGGMDSCVATAIAREHTALGASPPSMRAMGSARKNASAGRSTTLQTSTEFASD
jgi:predicted PP-loop superfamily ATPase